MSKAVTIIASIVLILHGLVHLMGTVVYTKMGSIEGLKYKTTLLGGRWDLGERGIAVYGALWAVAAVAFIVAAAALWAGAEWWRPLVVVVTLFSLALTALDLSVAYAGAALNVLILAALWLGPRIIAWFSR